MNNLSILKLIIRILMAILDIVTQHHDEIANGASDPKKRA